MTSSMNHVMIFCCHVYAKDDLIDKQEQQVFEYVKGTLTNKVLVRMRYVSVNLTNIDSVKL